MLPSPGFNIWVYPNGVLTYKKKGWNLREPQDERWQGSGFGFRVNSAQPCKINRSETTVTKRKKLRAAEELFIKFSSGWLRRFVKTLRQGLAKNQCATYTKQGLKSFDVIRHELSEFPASRQSENAEKLMWDEGTIIKFQITVTWKKFALCRWKFCSTLETEIFYWIKHMLFHRNKLLLSAFSSVWVFKHCINLLFID